MIVLFSIKQKYVEKIFSGEKGYEYRKAIFKSHVNKVVVYCTKPIGMIVGEFEIKEILAGHPTHIWEKTKYLSGIEEKFYKDYVKGKEKVYAIEIGRIRLYMNAVDPHEIFDDFIPPQSFRYLSFKDYEECLSSTPVKPI